MVGAQKVVLSGAHVIPLSQRDWRPCVRSSQKMDEARVPARCLRRRACHSSSVEVSVFAPSWEWQHWVVEVFYYFSHEKLHTFPRDIPIDPLDSKVLSYSPFAASDWRLFEHPFSSLPTSASQPGALFGFMPHREVCWEYSEDDRKSSIAVIPSVPLTVLCHTVFWTFNGICHFILRLPSQIAHWPWFEFLKLFCPTYYFLPLISWWLFFSPLVFMPFFFFFFFLNSSFPEDTANNSGLGFIKTRIRPNELESW